ncbi:hypothetical protein AC1031_010537 [Aphanomyces cochlioides]|nr:hypothetical protein AC1031_010537 [Aphanomyces cochlioides]
MESINQIVGRYGGACPAAAFLQQFIEKDVKWAHVDIAGMGSIHQIEEIDRTPGPSNYSAARSYMAQGATGFGVQVKKLSSAAALKMSNANSCSELRETNTHGVTIIPGPKWRSSSTPTASLETNLRLAPPALHLVLHSPEFQGVNLSGSVVDPQTTVVNLSSEALTQEGEPLGPCACGGCFPGLQLESIPSEGGEKTGSMPALEATRAPPMGTPCGSVYFPPGASSEGRGRYPDLGSRRSNGVPQSPCCGNGMDSPSTPVTGGLAPAFLVTNGAEPAATNRVAPCAEPPRTGEEEEKSQEDVDMVCG